jgi:E3 ubiquitin-protein ligase HUWE1
MAIKMGRATEKKPALIVSEDDSVSDVSMEDEDEGDESLSDEDEAPDLYRNSALGMYVKICFFFAY